MVKLKLSAFSFAEAIVSMIIIMVVTTASVPILTKAKPKIDSVGVRGQYACWYDDGTYYSSGDLVEWYFDERSPRTSTPQKVSSCTLLLDKKPSNFYIMAAGAGSSNNPGQLVTLYTPALSNQLTIVVGKKGTTGGDTTVTSSDTTSTNEIRALGAQDSANGLIPSNIKSCRFILENSSCANGSGTPIDCEVVDVLQNGSIDYYGVRINGCEHDDDYGNTSDDNIIDLSELSFKNNKDDTTYNLSALSEANVKLFSNRNRRRYYYGTGSSRSRLNFEFYDSSYTTSNRLLDLTTTENNPNKMAQIIADFPVRRVSRLTDLIEDLKPGAKNKNGAVLILW